MPGMSKKVRALLSALLFIAPASTSAFSQRAPRWLSCILIDDENAAQPAKVIPLDANRHRTSRIINNLVLNAVLAYHQLPYKPLKEVGIPLSPLSAFSRSIYTPV